MYLQAASACIKREPEDGIILLLVLPLTVIVLPMSLSRRRGTWTLSPCGAKPVDEPAGSANALMFEKHAAISITTRDCALIVLVQVADVWIGKRCFRSYMQ